MVLGRQLSSFPFLKNITYLCVCLCLCAGGVGGCLSASGGQKKALYLLEMELDICGI